MLCVMHIHLAIQREKKTDEYTDRETTNNKKRPSGMRKKNKMREIEKKEK